MSKAPYFIKNSGSPSLTRFDFSDQKNGENENGKDLKASEENMVESLANLKSDEIQDNSDEIVHDAKDNNDFNSSESKSEMEKNDESNEKYAEDQEEKNNILSNINLQLSYLLYFDTSSHFQFHLLLLFLPLF